MHWQELSGYSLIDLVRIEPCSEFVLTIYKCLHYFHTALPLKSLKQMANGQQILAEIPCQIPVSLRPQMILPFLESRAYGLRITCPTIKRHS